MDKIIKIRNIISKYKLYIETIHKEKKVDEKRIY